MRWRTVVACILGAACAPPPAVPERSAPADEAAMPGPAPRRAPIDALALNGGCVGCHRDVAAEWSGSMHERAYTDAPFQHALAIEPLPFCRGCHAPEADPTAPPPPALAALGVSCVSCHLVDGVVLAAARVGAHGDPHAGRAPPVRRSADYATAAACAACHEFAFPDPRSDGSIELMQSTVSEAAHSPNGDRSCASCHMPVRERRRSHSFASTRSPEALAAALAVRAERRGSRVVLTLATRGVGHAFPTGDLFRRLALEAEAVGADMNDTARARRHLARHFESRPNAHGLGRTLRRDDRPGGRDHGSAPVRVELDLGPPAERAAIAWQVSYERVAHPAPGDPAHAHVVDRVPLAQGLLPAPGAEADPR